MPICAREVVPEIELVGAGIFAVNDCMGQRSLAAWAMLYCLGLSGVLAQDNPSQAMIQSVLDRNGTCIASTRFGLYEATDAEKIWRKLSLPKSIPLEWGRLAQQSVDSPLLVYSTGIEIMESPRPAEGCLCLSKDAGKSWIKSSIDSTVLEAFINPDGAIYAITERLVTTPFPAGGDSVSTTNNDVRVYPSHHLVVSRDDGQSWKDITPTLKAAFGLYGIFPDPKHPGLICVRSEQIGHTSQTFFYQAEDANYHWKEIRLDEWPGDRFPSSPWRWRPPGSGYHGSNMPATLENFFKYPYECTGSFPDLPTEYLISEKPSYRFHLNQPMPVVVATCCMESEDHFTLRDTRDVKKYWGLRIGPEGETEFSCAPEVTELYTNYPDHAAKLTAYASDPVATMTPVDQKHPYRRTIDLRQFYDFAKPGKYRVQITHTDEFPGNMGGTIGTAGFDLTIMP